MIYGSRTAKTAKRNGVENSIELQVVDVPTSELETYRASNILKNRTGIEYEPEDFLIPISASRSRVPMSFTGNILVDNKLELPQIKQVPIFNGSKTITIPLKQTRVVSEGTYPLYTGPKHSVTEVVNPDGTVNPRVALRIEREVADNIPGAYRMESRLENPEWHVNDPNT